MVYMHGSGGLTWHNARYARAAAGFSYVVVCPDEMAGSRFRSRATRALLTSRDATGYWENSLFYSGAKSAEGESLEFNTKVDEVLDDKEHFKTLYQKVYFVRRAELHFTLSRLPRFASHVGVVIMGTSEGAMTVSRFDDQRYGSMIVGRIIASYAAEFCYMHSRPEDALLGGQKDVPTLNLIGSHDEFFGPPAHGTFSGSAASIIAGAAVKQGWGKVNITGNAYRSMAEQGVLSGLTVTFPGAKHDITLSHNHAVRDIFLDFLQQPHRCASVLARWETHPFLGAHAILVRKCAPAGTDDAATDEGVPGQRVTWIDMRANPKYPPTLPHRVAIRSRATEKEVHSRCSGQLKPRSLWRALTLWSLRCSRAQRLTGACVRGTVHRRWGWLLCCAPLRHGCCPRRSAPLPSPRPSFGRCPTNRTLIRPLFLAPDAHPNLADPRGKPRR
uniref:Uncharacterized protein n=2 Tax=Prymnesium polylepis TaxID=72548 RepID=A0A6T8E2L3_9EUKA|mmetsp:Transcript_9694/g.23516  ORF Transcript_9694/g.23516 Transcript_9694/m.23516 type:complete len:444 (+) Transcript_9694:282-1613(+)